MIGFFEKVAKDDRLGPLHICLYVTLFQFWNASRFKNPMSISRNEVMRLSKIGGKATYHKCMKELDSFGYLRYDPSFNPLRGSLIYLFNIETGLEMDTLQERTQISTGIETLDEPYINNTNIINSKHCKQHKQNETDDTSSNFDGANTQEKKPVGQSFSEGRKSSTPGGAVFFENKSGKETRTTVNQQRSTKGLPLSVEEVKIYFAEQKSSSTEAEKFYNYFQSNGWKVGGRAPMKDWQAAARNWLLNADKFTGKGIRTVSFSPDKDYAEPL
jgi:hypothetical protein